MRSLLARLAAFTLPVTVLAVLAAGWLTVRAGSGDGLSGTQGVWLGVTAGVAALLTVGASALVARQISRPLGELTQTARRMTHGALDERVPEPSIDELYELARAFNAMAGSLAHTESSRRRLTSDVAHELRAPLSNIRGYLEATQEGVTPLTPELVNSIHEETLLLQTLVDDLQELTVAMSGKLRLQRSTTDLDELTASVAKAHQARAARSAVHLTVEAHSGGRVDVDPRRIRQVLTNLLDNALRHTGEHGSITLSTRRDGNAVEVRVHDNGAGIPAYQLPFVFDRFYRADGLRAMAGSGAGGDSTPGSGLGLAIARELVTAHGGRISVSSTEGQGSTFTVRLPALEEKPPTGGPRAEAGPARPRPRQVSVRAPARAAQVGRALEQTAATPNSTRDSEPVEASPVTGAPAKTASETSGETSGDPARGSGSPVDVTYIDVC